MTDILTRDEYVQRLHREEAAERVKERIDIKIGAAEAMVDWIAKIEVANAKAMAYLNDAQPGVEEIKELIAELRDSTQSNKIKQRCEAIIGERTP